MTKKIKGFIITVTNGYYDNQLAWGDDFTEFHRDREMAEEKMEMLQDDIDDEDADVFSIKEATLTIKI